jgi:hypothetical protein
VYTLRGYLQLALQAYKIAFRHGLSSSAAVVEVFGTSAWREFLEFLEYRSRVSENPENDPSEVGDDYLEESTIYRIGLELRYEGINLVCSFPSLE